jgi:DNA primase catalytic core
MPGIYEKGQLVHALTWASYQYSECLSRNPRLQEYLKGRGFTKETITEWGIGYAPNDWQFLTRQAQNESGEFTFDHLKETGLVTEKDTRRYDRFVHRLTFPIHDAQGDIISFTARKHPDDLCEEGGKYINGPQTDLYTKQNVLFGLPQAIQRVREKEGTQHVQEVFITEGAPDVILAHQSGLYATLAPCGTAYTLAQCKAVRRWFPNATQVLCFDGDTAGNDAMTRKVEDLFGADLEVTLLPSGKDLADLCTEGQNVREYLQTHRISDLAFLWRQYTAEKDMQSSAQQMQALRKIAPVIKRAPQERWEVYAAQLATLSQLPQTALESMLYEGKRQHASTSPRSPTEITLHPFALKRIEILFMHHLLATDPDPETYDFFGKLFQGVPVSNELRGLLHVYSQPDSSHLGTIGTGLWGAIAQKDLEAKVQATFPRDRIVNTEYLAHLIAVHPTNGEAERKKGNPESHCNLKDRVAILLAHAGALKRWEEYKAGKITLEMLKQDAQKRGRPDEPGA